MGKALRKNTARRTKKSAKNGASRRSGSSTRRNTSKPNQASASPGFARECLALILLAIALFTATALVSEYRLEPGSVDGNSMGSLGAYLAQWLIGLLGVCAFSVSLVFLWATKTVWQMKEESWIQRIVATGKQLVVVSVLLLSLLTIAAVLAGQSGGGLIGVSAAGILVSYVNTAGAILISALLLLLTLIAITDLSFSLVVAGVQHCVTAIRAVLSIGGHAAEVVRGGIVAGSSSLWQSICEQWQSRQMSAEHEEDVFEEDDDDADDSRTFVLGTEEEDDSIDDEYEEDDLIFDEEDEFDEDYDELSDEADDEELDEFDIPQAREVKIWRRDITKENIAQAKAKAREEELKRQLKDYRHPSLELLVGSDPAASFGPEDDALLENSQRLEQALQNFRIGGHVVEVHPGPVITLYQFAPAPGVKVQRIINLADDLALALKVASVRVYAPVPGKGTVGVEVPNQQREIVRLKDVLESEDFSQGETPLPLALGKDTYGESFIAHLPRMPHLLIAGATGTGKSVCINSMLLSLLVKNSPEDLNLIMIDPKMLELSIYEDIPHLKAPVVTNAKRARGVLWWTVEEMERRYRLLKNAGVRDIAAYNRLCAESESSSAGDNKARRKNVTIPLQERDVVATGSPYEGLDRAADAPEEESKNSQTIEKLPRIVVVVDELADLMLSVGREIEDLLARLAQKARAAGIHLILATQRPSVNVITGLIKANFPARISFKVASKIDARTVLDTSGSEKLLGQGDMLFLAPWLGQLKRLHSPYVSDQEVHDICDWLRKQGSPMYDASIEQMIAKVEEAESGSSSGSGGAEEYDEFYDRAVSLVVDKGQASTSMVQRAFRIGYNRAARILETMEREGIVGPADGAKPRPVLIGAIESNDGI